WIQRLAIQGSDLPTVSGNFGSEFVPTSSSQWAEVEITNINPVFFTEEFRFRFEFTSNFGNNIYIDNINLYDPATVGLEEIDFMKSLDLYPNPTSENLTINYNLNHGKKMIIDILDITGRLILPVSNDFSPAGIHSVNANVTGLSPGIYFVRLQVGNRQIVRRFAVQN